ncbi:MAG: hypothetical protein KDA87_11775 [Planctomycetales bacterium]|nr:hypothetical protein [Planctomycetales bacterium]
MNTVHDAVEICRSNNPQMKGRQTHAKVILSFLFRPVNAPKKYHPAAKLGDSTENNLIHFFREEQHLMSLPKDDFANPAVQAASIDHKHSAPPKN